VPSRPRPRPKPIKRPAEGGIKAAIEGPSFSDIGSSSVVQATPVGQVRERENASQTILPPQLSSVANKDARLVPTSKKRKRPNVIEIFSDEDDAPQSSASKIMPEPLVEKPKGKKKVKVDKSARVVKEGKEGSEKIFKSKEFVDDDDELDILGPSAEQHVSTSIIAPTPVKEKKNPKKDQKTVKPAAKGDCLHSIIILAIKRSSTDVIALPISDTVIETTHIISNPEEHVGTSGDTTASRKVSSSAQDRDAQARPTKKTNAKENDGNKEPSTSSKSKPPTSETRDTNGFSTSSPRRVLKAVVEISRFSTPKSTGKKPAMVDSPSVDANKSFRVPARTKTPMSELLMKVQQRPSAASPSALKVSRSSLSRIAPLHPNRKPAPPPPPRVSQKERKTKAQQMEEEQWEEEWEEQYGEAWYEMPEEEKARMRRERRDQLWVED
jgi:hypothetical protein